MNENIREVDDIVTFGFSIRHPWQTRQCYLHVRSEWKQYRYIKKTNTHRMKTAPLWNVLTQPHTNQHYQRNDNWAMNLPSSNGAENAFLHGVWQSHLVRHAYGEGYGLSSGLFAGGACVASIGVYKHVCEPRRKSSWINSAAVCYSFTHGSEEGLGFKVLFTFQWLSQPMCRPWLRFPILYFTKRLY